MIVNLALLRGMAGRPHAGLMPIRGHSNVQGIGSVGVAPVLKQAIVDRLECLLGVRLPAQPGLDTMACMREGPRPEVSIIAELGRRVLGDASPIDWTSIRPSKSFRSRAAPFT